MTRGRGILAFMTTKVHQETIEVATKGRGTYDATDAVERLQSRVDDHDRARDDFHPAHERVARHPGERRSVGAA